MILNLLHVAHPYIRTITYEMNATSGSGNRCEEIQFREISLISEHLASEAIQLRTDVVCGRPRVPSAHQDQCRVVQDAKYQRNA